VIRKVTLLEIAAREDLRTDEAADQDPDQDRQDGTEIETIEDEEAEPQTDTTETGDTTERDGTGIEAEGLLLIPDLTNGVLEAEEAIEETRIETMTEETAIEIDTSKRIDAEEAEELVPGREATSLCIPKGRTREVSLEVKEEWAKETEAVKEERIEENQEEKDLDPDLQATAEKTQNDITQDLEAPAPANAVKEIKKVVPKEKTTIMPPVSMKETVNFLKDPEIKVRQIKAITKIKAESLLKTRMKTTSE
jgi:hypothetical protein